jgi:hypothetical protein
LSSKKQNRSLKQDFISRLSQNKQHIIALAVLFILPVILYSAIFVGGQKFFGNDVMQWRAGAESIIEYQEQHDGENPNWASNMFSGMPAYTISQPAPVPNFDTFLKAISGDTYPLPFYWVLLGGVYFFFVIQGFKPLASATGSIFISFTTYLPIIIEAGHYNKFVAYAFIPWMLAGYWMLSRSDKKWLGLFIFALSVTLELRANHPQVTYYFLYLLGSWWILDTVMRYRSDQLREWGVRTGLMIGGGLLAILCSLEGYLTLYEYSQFSTRGGSTLAGAASGGGLDLQYAFRWSQGFGELLTLIIPGIFGGASGEAYWGPKSFTSGPHYLGAITFVLALIGLFRYKKRIKYLFLGVGMLTMLFALGHHFRLWNELFFNYMPYFAKFRTPEMWLIVSVFCFSVLAVFGIQALFGMAREKKKSLQPLYLPLGIALGVGLMFALANDRLLSFEKPGERQQIAQQVAQQNNVSPENPQVQQRVSQFINNQMKPERKALAQSDSIRYLMLVLLAGGLIFLFYRQKLSVGFFLAGLIILASYDMISIGNRYINEQNLVSDDYDAEQILAQQERPIDTFLEEGVMGDSDAPYPYRVFPLLDNPFNNAVPAYFYPSIGGYSGAKLSYYQDLIDTALMQGGSVNMAVLDMLNVKYVTYNQALPLPNMEQVYSQDNQVVMENTDVLPKAFFVDSLSAASSPQEAVDQLNNPDFKPATRAIVESGEPEELPDMNIQADSTAQVDVTEYQANKITLTTSRETPGFMVLSEIWYPAGWKATIDGKTTPIYKTNFVLRGIEVPEGEHEITFAFEPASVYWGNLFSWIGHALLLCLMIGAIAMGYKKKSNVDSDIKSQD